MVRRVRCAVGVANDQVVHTSVHTSDCASPGNTPQVEAAEYAPAGSAEFARDLVAAAFRRETSRPLEEVAM